MPLGCDGSTTTGPDVVLLCSRLSSLASRLRNCTAIWLRSRAEDAGISSKLPLLPTSSSDMLPLSDSTGGRMLISDAVSSTSSTIGATATFRGTGSVSTGVHDPTIGGSQSSPCRSARLPCTCNLRDTMSESNYHWTGTEH